MSEEFLDEYEKLFGTRPQFDPIKQPDAAPPRPRLDLTSALDLTSQNPTDQLDYDSLFKDLPKPTPPAPGYATALGRSLKAGLGDVAAVGIGAAEYGARQVAQEYESPYVRQLAGEATTGLEHARQGVTQWSNDIMASLSPEQQDEAQRMIFTLDPNQTIFKDGPLSAARSLGLKLARLTPSSVATLLPGAVLFRVATAPAALAYMGATEAGMSLGGVQNQIAQEVEAMPEDKLIAGSPVYAQMIQQGMDPAAARERLIAQAQGQAPVIAGLIVGAISAVAGRYLEPVFEGAGGNIVQRFGRGYASEALQEGSQGGVEQIAQNISAQVYDRDRQTMDQVGQQTLEQGALGGVFGGGHAAVLGHGNAPVAQPGQQTETTAPAASFEDVFGTGGENPFALPDERFNPNAPTPRATATPQEMEENGQQTMFLPEQGAPPQGELDLGVPQPLKDVNRQAVAVQPGQQGLPMRRRVRGGFEQVQEAPSAEPVSDIQAQLAAMDRGERTGVYLSAANLQNLGDTPLPGVRLDNFDDNGGTVIVPNDQIARRVQAQKDRGVPMQEILGRITGAGVGKPANGNMAVQRLDEAGNVLQESAVPASEAEAVAAQWKSRYPNDNVVTLTPEEVIQRREGRISEEQQARTGDLFTGFTPNVLPQQSEQGHRIEGKSSVKNTVGETIGYRVAEKGQAPADFDSYEEAEQAYQDIVDAGGQATLTPVRTRGEQTVVPSRAVKVAKRPVRRPTESHSLAAEKAMSEEHLGETPPHATSRGKAAAQLVQRGVKAAAKEKMVGGFFRPSDLEFSDNENLKRYTEAFQKLLDSEIAIEMEPGNREAKQTRAAALKELARARTLGKPRRKSERYVRAAEKTAPGVEQSVKESVARVEKKTVETPPSGFEEEENRAHVAAITPEQIDKMSDAELADAFRAAAQVESGRRQGVRYSYARPESSGRDVSIMSDEGANRGPTAAERIAEGSEPVSYLIRGQTYEQYLAAHKTPGEQRKELRRIVQKLNRAKYGGKPGGKGAKKFNEQLTKTATQTVTARGKIRNESENMFDTSVLTVDTTKADESVADRLKRQQRAKSSRKELTGLIKKATAEMDKLGKGRFAELAKETGPDGLMSKNARDLQYARMYYRQVLDFGRALLASNIDSASALGQMEQVSKFIAAANGMTADGFAAHMSNLAKADFRRFLAMKNPREDKNIAAIRKNLLDPEKRAETLAEWNGLVRRDAANLQRRTVIWRGNDVYNSVVEPLIMKYTDSTARDGYPSYRATRLELEGLKWALDQWNTDRVIKRGNKAMGTFREQMYKPMKRFFADMGFEFDANGSLQVPETQAQGLSYLPAVRKAADEERVRLTGEQLMPLYRQKFGKEKDRTNAPPQRELSASTQYKLQQRQTEQAQALAERAQDRYDEQRLANEAANAVAKEIGEVGAARQINRVIETFLERISHPKVTVEGLIRQEQRLIRAFKEAGLWVDTPSKAVGKIRNPITGAEKTFSIAGPRLEAKTLSKERARQLMKNLKTFETPNSTSHEAAVAMVANRHLAAETEFFLKEVSPTTEKGVNEFVHTAAVMQQTIDTGAAMGHELLDHIIENLPENHPYRVVAERMRQLDSANVPVSWTGGSYKAGEQSLGTYHAARPGIAHEITLSKAGFDDLSARFGPEAAANAQIHVMLHEMVHAATMHALENDLGVRQAFKHMRMMAQRYYRSKGLPIPYGLRDEHPIQEFVAEAFSNTGFQQQLKGIKYEKGTLWSKLLELIRQTLGIPLRHNTDTSLMDVIMATSDRLFTEHTFVEKKLRGRRTYNLESDDPSLNHYLKIGNNLFDAAKVHQTIARGKWLTPRAPLSLMTLGQIRENFANRLDGLDEYYRAFKRRDSRNSELMEEATRVSREWTKLTEASPETAVDFSWLVTQASVHGVHPDQPLSSKANEHIKEQGQKDAHAELRKAFDALPDEWKQLYKTTRKYYDDVIERESVLLAQNSLRAMLTKGPKGMTREEFDAKFSREKIASLNTKEKLKEAVGDLLDEEMVSTISAMRMLPRQRQGPYAPLSRYGDFVVEASKTREQKRFNTSKEAREWRAAQLAEDPTLEIVIRNDENGSTATVKEKAFVLAESATEAQLKRAELVEEYGEKNVTAVTRKTNYNPEATIQSNEALGRILGNLGDNPGAQSAIKQYYLRSLSDRSFRKHEIKRKLRRGYDTKLQHRNFNNYAQASSYYTAQLEHGWQMAEAVSKMEADKRNTYGDSREGVRKSELLEQILLRDQATANPYKMDKLVRKGVSLGQFMMLTSPSYWMVNSTQPYMVSLPYMGAKHGYGATIAAMGAAQKMIIHPLVGQAWNSKAGLAAFWSKVKTEQAFNVLDEVKEAIKQRAGDKAPELFRMLDALRRENVLDLSWSAELRDIAEGKDMGWMQRVLDASRIMSHLTEVNNRILTAVAAYNLERTRGTEEEAIEYAKKIVASTHFDYSSGNKPLLFRSDGPLGQMAPLVFQFMQWPQHMYASLITNAVKMFKAQGVERKEAAKILAGMLGTHLLAGGIIGATLQPIKWAIGLAMMALGSDDEPYTFKNMMSGATFDRLVQEGIAEFAGPAAAELLARGLPASAGSDMSSRMALGSLYFFDLKGDTAESTIGSMLTSMGGPWLTLGSNGIQAMSKIYNGDVERGVEMVMPKAIKDVMKTYRYASEGLVNNAGDTVLESKGIPPGELFLQALGFSSNAVSQFYTRQNVIKDKQQYGADRRDALMSQFVKADAAGRQDVLKEIASYNQSFPQARITRSSLLKAIETQRQRNVSYKRYGANLHGKQSSYAEEGWYLK